MIKKSKMGKEKSSRKAMLHIIHDYSEYSTIQGIARIVLLQWKLLNVIALGQSDNINQIITIADSMEYIKSNLGLN
jgi:hypothetical protein